jgi:hypothetical protein
VSKPVPEDYATRAEYRWALKLWRRRTGGSLLGTVLLAGLIGGLSGNAYVFITLIVLGVGLHLAIRATRG